MKACFKTYASLELPTPLKQYFKSEKEDINRKPRKIQEIVEVKKWLHF